MYVELSFGFASGCVQWHRLSMISLVRNNLRVVTFSNAVYSNNVLSGTVVSSLLSIHCGMDNCGNKVCLLSKHCAFVSANVVMDCVG